MVKLNSAIDFVMALGPIVWKFVKYQTCHSDYISEFQEMQKKLKQRQSVIDANLKTQLLQPGKIPNKEVEAWLEKVRQETTEEVAEDLICRGGYFTNIRSSRKLDKKTEELKQTFEQGEKYTNAGVSLVVDDHSIEYCELVFKENQKRLEHQNESIEVILKTQCMQPGKIARKEVKEWLEKASQQIAIKVEDLINQGESSSSSNLEKKIEELKQISKEGEKFTDAGVSLVVDDHSIEYCELVFKENQKRLEHQNESIEVILKTQCMQPGKIARKEVKEWLEKASQQIAIKVEDLINQGESSSSSNLEKKIEELKQISKEGEKFTDAGVSLVVDDHSIEYCELVFKENQKRLEHQKESIEVILKTQCMQPGKIARKEVKEWLEKASQQIAIKVEDLINQGESSSSSNLEKKIEELKQISKEGEKFTDAGVSLVVNNYSIAPVFKENQERLEHHKGSIEAISKTPLIQLDKIAGKGVEEVGKIAGKGVEEVGKIAVEKVGKIAGKGVKEVGKIAGKGVEEVGKIAVEEVGKIAGKGVEEVGKIAVEEVGKIAGKGVKEVGKIAGRLKRLANKS